LAQRLASRDATVMRGAIVDGAGSHALAPLLDRADGAAAELRRRLHVLPKAIDCTNPSSGRTTRVFDRVASITGRDATFAVAQMAAWRSGAVSVVLPEGYPASELEYYVDDSRASVLLASAQYLELAHTLAKPRGLPVVEVRADGAAGAGPSATAALPEWAGSPDVGATLIYTSGTTSKPKGALVSHESLTAQITALVDAWGWSSSDRLLHVLPLHHVHGQMAAFQCGLWSGATVEMAGKFDAAATWEALLREKHGGKGGAPREWRRTPYGLRGVGRAAVRSSAVVPATESACVLLGAGLRHRACEWRSCLRRRACVHPNPRPLRWHATHCHFIFPPP